jgi:hypothetical protein
MHSGLASGNFAVFSPPALSLMLNPYEKYKYQNIHWCITNVPFSNKSFPPPAPPPFSVYPKMGEEEFPLALTTIMIFS